MATYKFKKIDDNTSQLVRVATNADRIRAMTDEEMAEYLDGVKRSTYNCTMPCNGETCMKCWLDWLKQEAT